MVTTDSTTSVRYEYNGTEHGLQKYHEQFSSPIDWRAFVFTHT